MSRPRLLSLRPGLLAPLPPPRGRRGLGLGASASRPEPAPAADRECVAPRSEVVRFVADCLRKVGASEEHGRTVGEHLMTADYRGHFSHGTNRLQLYVRNVQEQLTDPTAKPAIVTDFQAIALVDGCNGFGHVVGKYCMELAIEKACKFGVGVVSARGSNHYGISGFYALMAVERGFIGMSSTNTSPLMVPTRSCVSAMGTNPIALAMNSSCGDQFALDMATTAVALGKIELARRKGQSIPEGWAMDGDGKLTTNPEDALKAMNLMPLGGTEETSGYKGYGLAVMAEVLCGVLSGSSYGPKIRNWTAGNTNANLGHFFLAINPNAIDSGASDRLGDLLQLLRALPSKSESKRLMVAGDPERCAMEKVDREGGIHYHENQIKSNEEIGKELGVEPMKLVRVNC